VAFNIVEFQKKLQSKPAWKPGRWETTSPDPDKKWIDIEYQITGKTAGRFRLKGNPDGPAPGQVFQLDGAAIFGWQRYNQ